VTPLDPGHWEPNNAVGYSATAAAIIAMMVSAGAVSKFNIIELITPAEIDHAYEALTDPVASGP
jgi:hypothetical protein